MRKTVIGLTMLGVLLIAIPAMAQATEIVIQLPEDTRNEDPGTLLPLVTEPVPEGLIGATCSGTAETQNDASPHPDNDFIISSGASAAEIHNWEATPGSVTSMSGTVILGDTITVTLRFGEAGISSGGALIILTCAQPTPETTTTTTVTTPPPVVTTTTSVTTPPPGETTTVPPPEGGVAAGGGGTAGGGFGALPWLAAGGFALLSAAAIYAGGQRKDADRE